MSGQRSRWTYLFPILAIVALVAVTACRSGSSGTSAQPTTATGEGGTGGNASPSAGGATTKEVGVTDTEIIMGSHYALSGPAASYSVIPTTWQAYFKKVNDEGGVNGRKITVKVEDDGYQPNRTVEVVKKLVEQDQVFAIFNGLGTPTHSAVVDYLQDKGVPDMYIASGASKWAYPVKKTVFGYQPDYISEGKILGRYAAENFKGKKMAVLYQNDDFGKDGLNGIEAALQKFGGGPLVAKESYETGATEVSAQMAKLKDSGAEVLFLYSIPNIAGYALNQKGALGWNPQVLASAVVADPSLFKLAPDSIEGLITSGYLPLFDDASAPGMQAHYDLLKKYAPQQPPQNFTVYGQAVAELMVETIKRAGKNLTRASLIEAAEQIKGWKNSFGVTIDMGPQDHAPIQDEYILKADKTHLVKITDYLKADF